MRKHLAFGMRRIARKLIAGSNRVYKPVLNTTAFGRITDLPTGTVLDGLLSIKENP